MKNSGLLGAVFDGLRATRPNLTGDLNPGCTTEQLRELGGNLRPPLPECLEHLYRLYDGQRGDAEGLFRGRCRWDKATRELVFHADEVDTTACRFLSLAEASELYAEMLADTDLDVFAAELWPFASNDGYTVMCVDRRDSSVWLLWTGGPDWTLPRDWQTVKVRVANGFDAYLEAVFHR